MRNSSNFDGSVLGNPRLSYGLAFEDLYARLGLERVDAAFQDFVQQIDEALFSRLLKARSAPSDITPQAESQLVLDLAPFVDDFIGSLFDIQRDVAALQGRHSELAPLYSVKRNFIQRRSLKGVRPDAVTDLDGQALSIKLETWLGGEFTELSFAQHVNEWEKNAAENADKLEAARDYAVWAALSAAGQKRHRDGVLFKQPRKLEPAEPPFNTLRDTISVAIRATPWTRIFCAKEMALA